MARINLLPHREEKRRERRSQFFRLAFMSVLFGALLGFLVYSALEAMLANQESRNNQIQTSIKELDKEIAEIKDLEAQIDSLLARKKVIESLQESRVETVKVLNELIEKIPEGVYLKGVKQTGRLVSLSGYAQSNARVSSFMAAFDTQSTLRNAALIETKAATVNNRKVTEFNFTVSLQSIQQEVKKTPPRGDK